MWVTSRLELQYRNQILLTSMYRRVLDQMRKNSVEFRPKLIQEYQSVNEYLGRVVDWVAEAQSFADKWGIKLEDVSITVGYHMGYYNNPEIECNFTAKRPETPEEIAKRIEKHEKAVEAGKKAAAIAKQRKADAEYTEYERLKKKFED